MADPVRSSKSEATSIRFGHLGELEIPLGLGLLKLTSAENRPAEAEAIALIHHALARGIRLFDVADVYGHGGKDLHYSERLMARALERWDGDSATVRIITKAGLARPKGRWMPDGRAKSLRAAVEGSIEALGGQPIFMLLLHAHDARVPFEESLSTLAELQADGKITHLGLCNTSIPEVHQAQRHFEIAAIQNELSVMDRKSATTGVVTLAQQIGAPFLAHRPMGGHAKAEKLDKNRAVKPLVAKYGITPYEAALAILTNLEPTILPLTGATRVETLDSALRALEITFDEEDWAGLTAKKILFTPSEGATEALRPIPKPAGMRKLEPGCQPGKEPEVVMIMGIQGAGKSTVVEPYAKAGYARLNRDEIGGTLDDLIPRLKELLASGQERVVLDNTYGTQVSRHAVIRAAHSHSPPVPVRCIHLATSFADATTNVVNRILDRYGELLGPEELKELAKTDPNLPPPAAMLKYLAGFEPPIADEGFSAIETIPFKRERKGKKGTRKGLLLDVDGTLRTTRSGEIYPNDPDDVVLLPGRTEILRQWIERGYGLFLVSNQSGVASGQLTSERADEVFARTVELLDLPVEEILYCPHPAFPVSCFCRKPMPGMGLLLMRKHALDPDQLVMVGDMESDEQFASNIGARYYHADAFFSDAS